jgi:DNA-binding transcriptional regulator YiaG
MEPNPRSEFAIPLNAMTGSMLRQLREQLGMSQDGLAPLVSRF